MIKNNKHEFLLGGEPGADNRGDRPTGAEVCVRQPRHGARAQGRIAN